MYEARGITVRYGRRTVLDAADLALAPGRITVVVGPNGAGKSTLLRVMAGERRPEAGSVILNGVPVASQSAASLAAQRAVLAQSIALSAPFTVDEIVRLGIPAHVRRAETDALVTRALAAVELPGEEARPITHLSGGEQQRIHAARALAQLWAQPQDGTPRYLLLDEPTAHLDPAHQLLLMKLARTHAANGGGVLAILHDLNLALAVADQIAVLSHGCVMASGAPDTLITPELLGEVYGVPFRIINDGGRRWVAPHAV